MNKLFGTTALALILISAAACTPADTGATDETPAMNGEVEHTDGADNTGDSMEENMEAAGDSIAEAAHDAGEAMEDVAHDAGEVIEDMGQELQEATDDDSDPAEEATPE